jgi:16S rRNA (adenine1518-N6/adenine1519-N6)-dimethyltransferase
MSFSPKTARKRFGQHFLVDQNILRKIISAISPKQNEHFLEIGPGTAALTEHLLPHVGQLDLVEIDRDLAALLEQQYQQDPRVHIYCADALFFDLSRIASKQHPIRVAGNLPYNISTPLIFKLLEQRELVKDMHFLLQKEVVDRLTAKLHSADYSRLSVMAQYYCDCTALFRVSAQSFNPPPQVESAVVRLVPFVTQPFLAENERIFAKIVKEAFTYRRKTLANALKSMVKKEVLQQAGIDPSLRPQDLTVEEYVRISNQLTEHQNS